MMGGSSWKWLCSTPTRGSPAMMMMITVQLAPFQCIAPLAANNLQSGLSSASSVASSTLRLWYVVLHSGQPGGVRTSCQPFPITLRNCCKNSPGIIQVAKQHQTPSLDNPSGCSVNCCISGLDTCISYHVCLTDKLAKMQEIQ